MGSGTWVSVMNLAIAALIVYLIVKAITGKTGKNMHCMTCGTDGPTRTRTRGSILIEIILWLMFIVPGLIYSIWRLTTRRDVCGTCDAETVVPVDAPAAVSHRKSLVQ